MAETTKRNYRRDLLLYGIDALRYALGLLTEKEEYEECKEIVDAINYHNNRVNDDLPTSPACDYKLSETQKRYAFSVLEDN